MIEKLKQIYFAVLLCIKHNINKAHTINKVHIYIVIFCIYIYTYILNNIIQLLYTCYIIDAF